MEKLTIYPIQRKGNMFEEKLVSACRGITNEMCILFFSWFLFNFSFTNIQTTATEPERETNIGQYKTKCSLYKHC